MTAGETRRVRTRYAPSPTGDPHVGNIRTALWSWLYSRHCGGDFVVRLEDTDRARAVPGSLDRILESLRWLGVDWDEGPDIGGPYAPYVQSERLERYQHAAQRLLDAGHAYRAFETPEELDAMRKEQQSRGEPTGYWGPLRPLSREEQDARAARGEPHVIRFRMPDEGTTTFHDLLRGDITTENRLLDDFVIMKADGYPTYHLAHVVDDEAMEISHVTRGEEWIPSAPRHACLIDALGYRRPTYCHNPVILGPDGGKLSKRHGAKFVLEYAEDGYLPEALFNYLVMLGWSIDDHTEIASRDRMVEVFDLADLSDNAAKFDHEKLEWMNGVYIREQVSEDRLVELFTQRLEAELPADVSRPIDRGLVRRLVPLVRERVKLLSEVTPMLDFIFVEQIDTPPVEDFLVRRWKNNQQPGAQALGAALADLEAAADWTAPTLEQTLRSTAEQVDAKAGDLFMLIRVAVTGKSITPPLFETMEVLGRERCLERLRAAHRRLAAG